MTLGLLLHAAGVISLAACGFGYHFFVSSLIVQQGERNLVETARLDRLLLCQSGGVGVLDRALLVILDDRLGPFGRHATSLRAKNFAVMPANGKQPLIGGFGNWRGPPSMETVHQWAQRHSDADIVYLPWKTYIDHASDSI